MIEFILGVALSIPFMITLVILAIIFEHNEASKTAGFLAIIGAVVAANYFEASWRDIAIYAAGYAVFGVVWSFYRFKRFVTEKVAYYKATHSGVISKGDAAMIGNDIHPAKNIGKITAWILVWPFSFIDNMIGDVINATQTLIRTVFRSVYTRIYDKAMKDLLS